MAQELGYKGTNDQLRKVGIAIELGELAWHNKTDIEYFDSFDECVRAYAEGTAMELGIGY